MSLFGLDKWVLLGKTIKANGGIGNLISKMWRMDTVKEGTLMGWDANGNKYYENQRYMIGRSRWVEFNPNYKWEYDASQVTPEWFGWLHYKTDCLPYQDCAKYCLNCNCYSYFWVLPAQENLTNTTEAYYPYSTVRPKINAWDGCYIALHENDPHSCTYNTGGTAIINDVPLKLSLIARALNVPFVCACSVGQSVCTRSTASCT